MPVATAPIPRFNRLIYSENFSVGGVGLAGQKIIVPAGQIWVPIAFRGTFTTSAEVGNRAIHLGLTYEEGGKTIWTIWVPKSTPGSQKWLVRGVWGLGSNPFVSEWTAPIEGTNGVAQLPLPTPTYMRAGNKFYCEGLGELAGDKWTELSLTYELFGAE